jgi:tetratricopeptide (TPR) repeat protein
MSARDPHVLEALLAAAEGDPKIQAHVRAAHAERGAGLDCFQRDDFEGAKRHVEAAWSAVDAVLAHWSEQGATVFRGEIVEMAAILREDMALIKFRLEARFEEVVELLEFALSLHERLDPSGEGVVRVLGSLGDAYQQIGDPETARQYFERALAVERGGTSGQSR